VPFLDHPLDTSPLEPNSAGVYHTGKALQSLVRMVDEVDIWIRITEIHVIVTAMLFALLCNDRGSADTKRSRHNCWKWLTNNPWLGGLNELLFTPMIIVVIAYWRKVIYFDVLLCLIAAVFAVLKLPII